MGHKRRRPNRRRMGAASVSRFSRRVEQLLDGNARQVGEEGSLVVSTSEHQQGPPGGDGGARRTLVLGGAVSGGCFHGDDGVPRPGEGKLRQLQLGPAVGV